MRLFMENSFVLAYYLFLFFWKIKTTSPAPLIYFWELRKSSKRTNKLQLSLNITHKQILFLNTYLCISHYTPQLKWMQPPLFSFTRESRSLPPLLFHARKPPLFSFTRDSLLSASRLSLSASSLADPSLPLTIADFSFPFPIPLFSEIVDPSLLWNLGLTSDWGSEQTPKPRSQREHEPGIEEQKATELEKEREVR